MAKRRPEAAPEVAPAADLAPKRPSYSAVAMTELVLPNDANVLGTVFGGKVLSWIDAAGAIAAIRHCRRHVVTVSLDNVTFHAPIKVGWFALFSARLNGVGRTSMEVSVEVSGEDPLTGARVPTTSAIVTYVARDDAGRPVPVPPLLPETDDDRARAEAARLRREARRG
jgi:acyl-CoA hydrolase